MSNGEYCASKLGTVAQLKI